jgi:hypothetical protein
MKRVLLSVLVLVSCVGGAWGQEKAAPQASGPAMVAAAPKALADRPGTGPAIDLHPKWTVGDVTVFEYDMLNNSYAQAPDDPKKKSGQLFRQLGRVARKVVAADGKGVTLSMKFERLYMQVAMGTSVMYYDSSDGDNPSKVNELTGPVKACLEREIIVKLGPAGEVLSVTGHENAASPATPLPDDGPEKLWRPMYGLDKPGLEAKVGEVWTTHEENSNENLGTFTLALHNELKSATDGVALISVTADVSHEQASGPTAMKTELTEQTVTGEYEWDLVKGNLMSWSTAQDMKMDVDRVGTRVVMGSKVTTRFMRADVAAQRAAAARAKTDEENAKLPKATMGPDGKPVPVKP